MAVAVVQSGLYDSDIDISDTATVVLDDPVTEGNLLLGALSYFLPKTPITPDGWVEVDNINSSDAGLVLYERIAEVGDGDTFIFETDGGDFLSAAVIEISGQAASSYINQIAPRTDSNGTSHTTATITPSVLNTLVLVFLGCDVGGAGGADSATVGSGFTILERPYPTYHPLYLARRDALTSDTVTGINTSFSSLQDSPNASLILAIAPSVATTTSTSSTSSSISTSSTSTSISTSSTSKSTSTSSTSSSISTSSTSSSISTSSTSSSISTSSTSSSVSTSKSTSTSSTSSSVSTSVSISSTSSSISTSSTSRSTSTSSTSSSISTSSTSTSRSTSTSSTSASTSLSTSSTSSSVSTSLSTSSTSSSLSTSISVSDTTTSTSSTSSSTSTSTSTTIMDVNVMPRVTIRPFYIRANVRIARPYV